MWLFRLVIACSFFLLELRFKVIRASRLVHVFAVAALVIYIPFARALSVGDRAPEFSLTLLNDDKK